MFTKRLFWIIFVSVVLGILLGPWVLEAAAWLLEAVGWLLRAIGKIFRIFPALGLDFWRYN